MPGTIFSGLSCRSREGYFRFEHKEGSRVSPTQSPFVFNLLCYPFSSTTHSTGCSFLSLPRSGTLIRFPNNMAGNMISSSLALLLLSQFAIGAVTPTAPGPGEVFAVGSECSVSWTPDQSGKWKSFTIGLLTSSSLTSEVTTTTVSP